MVRCNHIIILNLIWTWSSFQHQMLQYQACFRSKTREAASYVLHLVFAASLIFLCHKFCFSFAVTHFWYPRNPTMMEKNRYSQQSRITNIFMALSFDREGQSFSEFIHNPALAFNSWKLLLDTQLPWNHREWQPLS